MRSFRRRLFRWFSCWSFGTSGTAQIMADQSFFFEKGNLLWK